MALMSALEVNRTLPFEALPNVQSIFDALLPDWEVDTCAGGIRLGLSEVDADYIIKSSSTNGAFFNLAARLALFTGNSTYAGWAALSWDWAVTVGLISRDFQIYSDVSTSTNCTGGDRTKWSYETTLYLLGGATLYNFVSFMQACSSPTICLLRI